MSGAAAILVAGPGAVGRLLAARWALAGLDVLILGRDPARESALCGAGITFITESGRSQTVRGPRPARATVPGPSAAAFFCVKCGQVPAAIRTARPWIGPDTVVVGLQNGLGHQSALRRAFGPRRTVLGSLYVAAERRGAHGVAHNGGSTVLLARHPANAEALQTASALLSAGDWEVAVKRDEDRVLWTKLVFNAAVNPLGALAAATNGALAEDPALRRLVGRLAAEAAAVARAAGHPPLYRMEPLILRGCRNSAGQTNSMLQDLRAGRPTEAPWILGPILREARRRGVPAPGLRTVRRVLSRLETRSRSPRP